MSIEYLLKHEGVDPSRAPIFIDTNSIYRAHLGEIAHLRMHITSGVYKEFMAWADKQARIEAKYGLRETPGSAGLVLVKDDDIPGEVYRNASRFRIVRANVQEMEFHRLVIDDGREISEKVTAAAKLNAKQLAARASNKYMSVWEASSDSEWRKKQIEVAAGWAEVKYLKYLIKHGLSNAPGYELIKAARIRNVKRHIGYIFDDFCKDQFKAQTDINNNMAENEVDQRLLITARYFMNRRDKKDGREKVIVSEDVDLIEMFADLSFIAPKLIHNLRVIRPRRQS